MGNTVESEQIRRIELQEQAKHSNLSITQVQNLWQLFNRLSKSKQHDGFIDEEEYMSLFKSKNEFNHRLFRVIDINKDRVLNFREWVEGFSRFKAKSNNSRVMLAFEIMSDGKDIVTKEGIIDLMKGLTSELQLNITPKELEEITQSEESLEIMCSQKKGIDCEEFRKHIEKHPQILEWMYYELQ